MDGSQVSDCPLPCRTTHTQTKFLNKFPNGNTEIDIAFSSKVKVTTTEMMKPTLSGFLSKVNRLFVFCRFHEMVFPGWRLDGTLAGAGGRSSVAAGSILPPACC